MKQIETENPEVVSSTVYGKSYENRDIAFLKVKSQALSHDSRVHRGTCQDVGVGVHSLSAALYTTVSFYRVSSLRLRVEHVL